jgi:4,5-dihydroxyphthalate decarboxylase
LKAARVAALELSAALYPNPRTRPVLDGRVDAAGIRLMPTGLTPGEMFWRQLKFADFDVSEMSFASFIIATAHAPTAWVALPVFTERRFFHTGVLVRRGAGITTPADLANRPVGVPEYQQTAVVWVRGILEHHFGVDWRTFAWYMERSPERSHGGATGFTPPKRFAYLAPGETLAEMLLDGRIDATLFYTMRNTIVDRRPVNLAADPRVMPLFPDSASEGRRFFAATGLFPINHCVIVRRALVERDPWVARSLYTMFCDAKAAQHERAVALAAPFAETGTAGTSRDVLANDPMPYGIRANRAVLATIAQYLHEQALTERVVALEELFAPATLED